LNYHAENNKIIGGKCVDQPKANAAGEEVSPGEI
jgi:hypothetical protein